MNRLDLSRETIILIVRDMIRQGGWEAMSVRKIAEKINYSTIKIYQEFGSKEGLRVAIQEHYFTTCKDRLEDTLQSGQSPAMCIANVSALLWEFSIEDPLLFDLAFASYDKTPPTNRQPLRTYMWKQLKTVVPSVDEAKGMHWWALTYGFISLNSRCEEDLRPLFDQAIADYLRIYDMD